MLIRVIILVVILYFLIKKGYIKSIIGFFSKKEKLMTIDDKYNSKKVSEEKELNFLLEKINNKSLESLSEKDKARLDELSKK